MSVTNNPAPRGSIDAVFGGNDSVMMSVSAPLSPSLSDRLLSGIGIAPSAKELNELMTKITLLGADGKGGNALFLINMADINGKEAFDCLKGNLDALASIKEKSKLRFKDDGKIALEVRSSGKINSKEKYTDNLINLSKLAYAHYTTRKFSNEELQTEIERLKSACDGLRTLDATYHSEHNPKSLTKNKQDQMDDIAATINFMEVVKSFLTYKQNATIENVQEEVGAFLQQEAIATKDAPTCIMALARELMTWDLRDKEGKTDVGIVLQFLVSEISTLNLGPVGDLMLAEALYGQNLLLSELNELKAKKQELEVEKGKFEKQLPQVPGKSAQDLLTNRIERSQADIAAKETQIAKKENDLKEFSEQILGEISILATSEDKLEALKEWGQATDSKFKVTAELVADSKKLAQGLEKTQEMKVAEKSTNVHWERFKAAGPLSVGALAVVLGGVLLNPGIVSAGVAIASTGLYAAIDVYKKENPNWNSEDVQKIMNQVVTEDNMKTVASAVNSFFQGVMAPQDATAATTTTATTTSTTTVTETK